MKSKSFAILMTSLFFASMLTMALCVQAVKAELHMTLPPDMWPPKPKAIYIRADGSVDPPTNITSLDNVTYTFTANIRERIVIVQRNNILVDGAIYTLQGTSAYTDSRLIGMNLTMRSNVTIKNLEIKSFYYGVYLSASSNNTITGNNITKNSYGIWLRDSSDNAVSGNVMNSNAYSFLVEGDELSHFVHSIDASNLVNGKPVYYLINQTGLVINSATYPLVGYLGLINCVNVTVEGLTLTSNRQGLFLAYTNSSRITDNNITDNSYGVKLFKSSKNIISGNNITNNKYGGTYLDSSSNNTITGNNITKNNCGVSLRHSSSYNIICGNDIVDNDGSIELDLSSNYNNIFDNIISDNNIANNSRNAYAVLSLLLSLVIVSIMLAVVLLKKGLARVNHVCSLT